jgi:hypothetical protein
VVKFVDSQDYCTVSYCACRQRKNLDPEAHDCKHPLESLILERREEPYEPPKDVREWMQRWNQDRQAASGLKK